jgi:hypothetical protein
VWITFHMHLSLPPGALQPWRRKKQNSFSE